MSLGISWKKFVTTSRSGWFLGSKTYSGRSFSISFSHLGLGYTALNISIFSSVIENSWRGSSYKVHVQMYNTCRIIPYHGKDTEKFHPFFNKDEKSFFFPLSFSVLMWKKGLVSCQKYLSNFSNHNIYGIISQKDQPTLAESNTWNMLWLATMWLPFSSVHS